MPRRDLVLATFVAVIWGPQLRGREVGARGRAAPVAPFTLLVPVVGIAAGHVAFGESISSRQWLGSGLLLAGLVANIVFARRAIPGAASSPQGRISVRAPAVPQVGRA